MAVTKEDILEAISSMSVMEVVDLISAMEEKFGVTAAAAVAAAPMGGGAEAQAEEEQTERSSGGEEGGAGPKKKGEALDAYCVNLNKRAREGRIDPLIGREPEVQRTIQVLCRRQKNNPLLVGDPGVGKTAIAEGLTRKIVTGEVPEVGNSAHVA